MSVSMTKGEGVTVFTMTYDSQSPCPPLCQMVKSLCYSPVCCTVSKHLRTVQRMSQSLLGALHIMSGLLNIGLGGVLLSSGSGSGWRMYQTFFPIWMGSVFILVGVICILSEKFPSPCLVSVNVILNITGVAFAITTIVLYSINLADVDLWWMCRDDNYRDITTSPEKSFLLERCLGARRLSLILLRGINGVLIILTVLELCVNISSAVLGIKALRSRDKRENVKTFDLEQHRPLLEEFTTK